MMMHTAIPPTDQLTTAQQRELARELSVQLARTERRLALVDALLEEPRVDDRGTATEERRALTQQRTHLQQALARLASGRYGQCVVCGALMPYGRLLLHPDAEGCSACVSRGDAAPPVA